MKPSQKWTRRIVLMGVLLGVMAITIDVWGRKAAIPRSTIRVIPISEGYPLDVAWAGNSLFVSLPLEDDHNVYSIRLWKLHPDGREMEMTTFPNSLGCEEGRYGFEAPVRLPDERLGYVLRCGMPQELDPELYLMAYDLHTEEHTALIQEPLPSLHIGSGGYSWNPEITRGIISDGNGRYTSEQLYWFTANDWESVDVDAPLAYAPNWAPDGSQIAFVAAPEQGRSGWARTDSFFHLYLMKPDGTEIRSLVGPFHHPSNVVWSPDGQWIVLVAHFGWLYPERSLWLVDAATGERQLILQGQFSDPAWSPDGDQLVIIEHTGHYPDDPAYIVVIDMTPMIGPE